MDDVTRVLQAIERGEKRAAEELLPLVYEELRRLAALRLAQEKPGQTLQPTALVHDAHLRLVSQAAELVKLRYFAGLSIPKIADVLSISPRTADRLWAYARAFLHDEIYGE